MELVVTTGAINHAKLQSNHHHQQTNIQFFYRPDALPVTQPTVSKHWRETVSLWLWHYINLLTYLFIYLLIYGAAIPSFLEPTAYINTVWLTATKFGIVTLCISDAFPMDQQHSQPKRRRPWFSPDLDFKVMVFFIFKYLKYDMRKTHGYYGMAIGGHIWYTVIFNDLEWLLTDVSM